MIFDLSNSWILCDDDGSENRFHHRAHHLRVRRYRNATLHHVHKHADAHGCVRMLRGHRYCKVSYELGGPAGGGVADSGLYGRDIFGAGADSTGAGAFGGPSGGSGVGGGDLVGAFAIANVNATSSSLVVIDWGPGHHHPPHIPATPEPATWVLLAAGLLAIGWRKWRRP